MKKRVLAMAFAIMMAFGAAACGGSRETVTEPESSEMTEVMDDEKIYDSGMAEEMLEALKAYDADLTAADAVDAGMFTIENGVVVGGQEKWDAFMAGETDSVMLCQFSANGGAMLDYVAKQVDRSYMVVSDLTRDGYEYEKKEDYKTQVFTEIKVFEDFVAQEGGKAHTVCVMTDDEELDAKTFLQYWSELSYETNGAFILFVI